jgi:hypothetical protein
VGFTGAVASVYTRAASLLSVRVKVGLGAGCISERAACALRKSVGVCWALVAEEPHRSTILKPRTFPVQGKRELPYLSSSPRKDEQQSP